MKKIKCNICGEKNINEDHDIYDCVENDEERRGIPRGTWMIQWMKRMNGKVTKHTDSNFVKWSKQHG
tara:strand:- start:388 stop:588 length:201 start_codon:yes stop_codon:yes gene_type:complete